MTIKQCRSCKSDKLKSTFSLGTQYLTGVFPKNRNSKISKGDLTICLCDNCKLLQLKKSFDTNEMYGKNYGYMSSLNKSMFNHLKNKVNRLKKMVSLNHGDTVIDIGSNDGTFLSFFSKNLNLVGVDPTIVKFSKFYKKNIIKISDFFSYENLRKKVKKKAKLITSISMFYDLEDPVKFAQDVEMILSNDGIWHFEQSYMPTMVNNISYDTICHEHLEYYSLLSLKYVLEKADLKIINIEFNDINGGSFALSVAKKNSHYKEEKRLVNWLLKKEKTLKIDEPQTFINFYKKCLNHKKVLLDLLKNLKDMKKRVLGYGASTKGNVILQFCGIDSKLINYIGEVNKFKFNKFTPGSNIKIISEKKMWDMKPDYLLILPWHFKNFFLEKEKKNIIKRGTKLIIPLPDIEII